MTKEELLKRLEDIDGEIQKLNSQISKYESQKRDVYDKIVELFCPHKIGQKVRFHYVDAVCTDIRASVYNGKISFDYTFRKIKKDGSLFSTRFYPYGEKEWLDEYYNFKE